MYEGILHVCGGDPKVCGGVVKVVPVFSTCVEVILEICPMIFVWSCILHVCGGDPFGFMSSSPFNKYSPRVWRWSRLWQQCFSWIWVFSTCVEVILWLLTVVKLLLSILHVCGGDPITRMAHLSNAGYSPRVWRWSLFFTIRKFNKTVFSTCVEVIPNL